MSHGFKVRIFHNFLYILIVRFNLARLLQIVFHILLSSYKLEIKIYKTYCSIAQRKQQLFNMEKVGSSILPGTTLHCRLAQPGLECLPYKQEVVGPNPTVATKKQSPSRWVKSLIGFETQAGRYSPALCTLFFKKLIHLFTKQ